MVKGDGREIICDLRQKGDIVGELAACDIPRRDRALALEPTEAIVVRYHEILDALQQNRAALEEVLRVDCQVLSSAYDPTDILFSGDLIDRLIRTLQKLANQFGRPAGHLIEIDTYLTQEEIFSDDDC